MNLTDILSAWPEDERDRSAHPHACNPIAG
jgi:hypothetical protein